MGTPGPSKRKILHNFYAKAAQVIAQGRSAPVVGGFTAKKNTWFNLHVHELESVKDHVQAWANDGADLRVPLNIEVAIDASSISPTQVLLLNARDCASDADVHNARYITLEQWSITLDRKTASEGEALAVFYKRLIVLVRSVHTVVCMLPAYGAYRRCKAGKVGKLRMVCRLTPDALNPVDLGHLGPGSVQELTVADLPTPEGAVHVRVRYRTQAMVEVNEHEQLLSSRFIENYFDADPHPRQPQWPGSVPIDIQSPPRYPSRPVSSFGGYASSVPIESRPVTPLRAATPRLPPFKASTSPGPEGLAFVASPSSQEDLGGFLRQLDNTPTLNMFSNVQQQSVIQLTEELAALHTLRNDFDVL